MPISSLATAQARVAAILDWEFGAAWASGCGSRLVYEVATRTFLRSMNLPAVCCQPNSNSIFSRAVGRRASDRHGLPMQSGFERGEQTDIKQAFVGFSAPTEMVLRVSRRLQPLLNSPA